MKNYLDFTSNYDRFPTIEITDYHQGIMKDKDIIDTLTKQIQTGKQIMVFECYPGVDYTALLTRIIHKLPYQKVICIDDYAFDKDTLNTLFKHHLTDDRVFGVMSHFTIKDVYPKTTKKAIKDLIDATNESVIVYGFGASHFVHFDTLVYCDMARWEIQQRFRNKTLSNWTMDDYDLDTLKKYKRGFFIEWRIADRLKQTLFPNMDYYLDTNQLDEEKMITGDDFRLALKQTVHRPFRLVPYFDPGVWGGQWMKEVCNLDRSKENFAWSFDGVMEENSVYYRFGEDLIESPSINLVFNHPQSLLGDHVHARFGKEFPIRFDFLDTMGGGNLSLQVHPLTEYIKDTFGMQYTQDESYYILDAGDDGKVYLGFKEGINPKQMTDDLKAAERGEIVFNAEQYINVFPAKKHDHFSIPAGTVHCSATDTMVLEISATPYIFTFKMWDWERLGLDGLPRPIHLEHALNNIQWDRDTSWVKNHLVNPFKTIHHTDDTLIERTGLHPTRQFIETVRHCSNQALTHETYGSVNVLNLVEGKEARVLSPTQAFEPMIVHYAETFIIPASVGTYIIEPYGESQDDTITTIKAYVRR